MTPEQIAAKFPEAVRVAREFRDAFGPGVRLIYARNDAGEELGRPLPSINTVAKLSGEKLDSTEPRSQNQDPPNSESVL